MAGTEHLESLVGNNLAELCSKSLYTLDGLWFTLLEKKYGLDVALDIDEEVWRSFCPIPTPHNTGVNSSSKSKR